MNPLRILLFLMISLNLLSAQRFKPSTVNTGISNVTPPSTAEQLERQVESKKIPDRAKINILRKICRDNIDTDHLKLKKYANKMLLLSEKFNDQLGKADAYNFLGVVEDIDSHFIKALGFYRKSLQLAQSLNQTKLIASVSNNIGLLEWKTGNYKEALATFFSALRYAEDTGSNKMQGNISSNIGLVFQELHQPQEALSWQKKALSFRLKDHHDFGLASTYNNLANAYSTLNKQDSSFYYQEKGISLQIKNDDSYGLGISYLNAGIEHHKRKNYKKSLWFYEQSKMLREKIQDSLGLSFTYMHLAEHYRATGDLANAIILGEQALDVSKNIQSDDRIAESSRSLAESYEKSGDLKKAIHLQQQYISYRDKVFSEEMIHKVAFFNIKYETEKKEKELSMAKLKVSKEVLASKQKSIWLLVLAGLFTVGLLVFRNLAVKSRLKEKQLALENDLLQEQTLSKAHQQRLEISRDLHDSVGSHLTLMSSTLDSLSNIADPDSSRAKEKISSLSAFVDLSISELRNTLWILNADEVFLEDLHLKILNFINSASQAKEGTAIKYYFEVQENVTLDSKVAANIFRILQEIISNSLKHSAAGLIDIQMSQNLDDLKMIISDNGKGFDFDTQKDSSFGLSNIQKRTDELFGTLDLETSPGKGTKYTIVIPLK